MTRQSGPAGASVVQEDAMPETYELPNGETRTTCGAFRTVGFYISGHLFGVPVWACRDCGAVMAWHESSDETVARKTAPVSA